MNVRPRAITLGLLLLVIGCAQPKEETPFSRGKAFFHEGKWNEAIEQFNLVIANNPLDAEAFLFRGQTYICKGSEYTNQAIADYNEAIRLNPEGPEAYYNRAIAYRNRGEHAKAADDDLTARRLDPDAARNRQLYSNADAERRLAIERALVAAPEAASKEEISADGSTETEPKADALSIPRPSSLNPRPSTVAGSPSSALPNERPGATNTNDGASLSGGSRSAGSVSEELFGAPAAKNIEDEPVRSRPPTAAAPTRRRPATSDWQVGNVPPASPTTPEPEAPRKRSLVGTLPYGNPYLPHQPNSGAYSPYSPTPQGSSPAGPSGYSPYSPYAPNPQGSFSPYGPTGPRPTGLQSNPQGRRLPSSPYSGGRSSPGPLPQPSLPYGP